jgi:TIR domain
MSAMERPMSGIFISYRRDDSEGQAGRLFEGLKARFGQDRVFIDVDGIEPGRDFRRIIDEHVSSCDVLLALIGRNWLHAADKDGRRRLDTPEDFVRLEIAAALRRDIAVIPVLVQGAAMPSNEELPPDLQALAWRNAAELRHTRWDADFAELAATLQSHSGYIEPSEADPPGRPSRWRWPVLAALSLAVFAIAIPVGLRVDNVDATKLSAARNSPSSGAVGVAEAAPIPAIRLDGQWKGTVTYGWGPTVDETFTLRLVGGTVAGSAGFLGHGRPILEGFFDGSSIRFVTKRIMTADTGDRWEAVNHYAGTMEDDKIDMVLSIEDAASAHEPVSFMLSRIVD